MRIFYFFVFVLTAQASNGEKLESETMTEVLLRAQAELALSNEFTETQFIRHRFRISAILATLTKFSINLYLDSIDRMKSASQDVREQINALEVSTCTENALDRFERNIIAHVNRLNFCLKEATRILKGEYYDLNYFDKDGARVANHVQNQSFHMMILNDPVDPKNDMYRLINRRLRDLLMRAAPWVANMDELEALMEHHIEQAEFGLTMCMRAMSAQFDRIVEAATESAQQCQ